MILPASLPEPTLLIIADISGYTVSGKRDAFYSTRQERLGWGDEWHHTSASRVHVGGDFQAG